MAKITNCCDALRCTDCACMYTYIHMYTTCITRLLRRAPLHPLCLCMYVYIRTYIRMHVYSTCITNCWALQGTDYAHSCMYICIHVCMHVLMYVCMYVCIMSVLMYLSYQVLHLTNCSVTQTRTDEIETIYPIHIRIRKADCRASERAHAMGEIEDQNESLLNSSLAHIRHM